MAQPFIGEIRAFGFNFAPVGWAFCDGQLVPISQSQTLFAVLGTTYGGNGTTTFALPNLQDRAPMDWGNGIGLTPRSIGETLGSSMVTITQNELPPHNHGLTTGLPTTPAGPTSTPGSGTLLGTASPAKLYSDATGQPTAALSNRAIGQNGGSQAHQNMQPVLTVNFCIALDGLYPSRN